jgi:hypothetical protein
MFAAGSRRSPCPDKNAFALGVSLFACWTYARSREAAGSPLC